MRLIIMLLVIGASCFVNSNDSWADFDVLDVALASSVRGRQPVKPVSPSAHCEKDKSGKASLPIIDSSKWRKVFLWARIASSSKGSIRHTWHQYINDVWETVSVVDLPISPSPGYRMWSAKAFRKINPIGDWMIVLAPSHEPQRVLCITRFSVK
mgnify:CR=1 FL=1